MDLCKSPNLFSTCTTPFYNRGWKFKQANTKHLIGTTGNSSIGNAPKKRCSFFYRLLSSQDKHCDLSLSFVVKLSGSKLTIFSFPLHNTLIRIRCLQLRAATPGACSTFHPLRMDRPGEQSQIARLPYCISCFIISSSNLNDRGL